MIIDEQNENVDRKQKRSFVRPVLGVIVTAAAVYAISQAVEDWSEVGAAFQNARLWPIATGVAVILVTSAAKAWRWRELFVTDMPTFSTSFWALQLNQFTNIVVPGRFGELARAQWTRQRDGIGRARSLGTIVVEKSIEMLFLLLSIAVLLPWVVLPDEFVGSRTVIITAVTTIGLISALYILAFQSNWTIRLVEMVAGWLPVLVGQKMVGITRNGLDGLAALRNSAAIVRQLIISTIITAFYIVTPWVLFSAFDLPFGLLAAALINFSTYLAILPPGIPGKFGVFELAVIWVLGRLDPTIGEATLLSYALIYHLVTMLPPVILGGIAAVNLRLSLTNES